MSKMGPKERLQHDLLMAEKIYIRVSAAAIDSLVMGSRMTAEKKTQLFDDMRENALMAATQWNDYLEKKLDETI